MKWMLVLLLPLELQAADLRDITHAKSSLQLELSVAKSDEIGELRADCRRELESTELPRSCFRALALEKSAGTRTADEMTREREWLERICLNKARVASRLASLKETKDLPEECQRAATERLADLRYRMENEAPEKLLEDRSDVR